MTWWYTRSASFLQRQIPIGVYRKLDKSLLPNLYPLDPSYGPAGARRSGQS